MKYPRTWKNPTKAYAELEKKWKTNDVAMSIFKGFRLTRSEFSIAIEKNFLVNMKDTDQNYEKWMSKWGETEKSFGYGLAKGD